MASWKQLCVVFVELAALQLSGCARLPEDFEASSTADGGSDTAVSGARIQSNPSSLDLLWGSDGHLEGDIVLRNRRNALRDEKKRWPNATLPYYIDPLFTKKQRSVIESAAKEVNKLTCVRLRHTLRTDKNWVHVTSTGTGCNSNVGMIGGRQALNLTWAECVSRRVVLHELLHALGLHHMHATSGRNKHVRILTDNIEEKHLFNFLELSAKQVTTYDVPYDYHSIMHYSPWAFSRNRKRTIVPTKPNVKLGLNHNLSAGDIEKVNRMYGCK